MMDDQVTILQAAGETRLPERRVWWMRWIISRTQSGGMGGLSSSTGQSGGSIAGGGARQSTGGDIARIRRDAG